MVNNKDGIYILIDLDRCWGCHACEVACKQEQDLGKGFSPLKVVASEIKNIQGKLYRDFVPTLCQHCDQAVCLEKCPTGAIYREMDGTVQVDKDICTGCGVCAEVCSFGVVGVTDTGQVVKCSLCFERRKGRRLPSCLQHCIGRALTLIEEKDLNSLVEGRYHWRIGRVVYVSGRWISLGKGID